MASCKLSTGRLIGGGRPRFYPSISCRLLSRPIYEIVNTRNLPADRLYIRIIIIIIVVVAVVVARQYRGNCATWIQRARTFIPFCVYIYIYIFVIINAISSCFIVYSIECLRALKFRRIIHIDRGKMRFIGFFFRFLLVMELKE